MHAYVQTYNAYSLDPKFSQQTTGCAVSHKIQTAQYKNIVFHTVFYLMLQQINYMHPTI